MGGAGTEVTEATTRVILESAIFHGPTIRNTARRLGLRSEASMRHEKGIGHELPRFAADRAAHLIAEVTGARVAGGIVDNDPAAKPARVVAIDLSRTERLLGIPLEQTTVSQLLRPLGFEVRDGPPMEVAVPGHRLDVLGPEDVAEEIARAHGYDRIPGRLPAPALPPFRPDPSEPRQRVRRVLAGMGLDEVLLHALIGPDDLVRSGYDPLDDGLVRVANPLAEQHSILRPTMYPSLLGALAENVRQRRGDAWLFEVGKTYWMGGAKGPATAESAGTGRWEAWHVAIALIGPRVPKAPDEEPPPADVASLKGIVDGLHAALGVRPPAYRAETAEELHKHLHPARAARILDSGGRAYGSLGEVHPRVADAWGLPGRPVIAAVNLGQLFALLPEEVMAAPIPAAQPIDRDLALSVEESTPLGELLRVLRSSAGPNLVEARVFDVYRGEQVGADRVSYAIALRFQPETAGDEEGVERAMNRLRGALQHHLGAQIR
ncbi:MAG TPA: phenylalanine--tRNA ligase subunit beta, partial [Candidatus Limnocylindrales bacterium]|nr:phenylalanine--tRNA ligase subunit beta [Candidatus Limnocylindrales bacterium]